jgi:surfactin synthase thioesterase subunit
MDKPRLFLLHFAGGNSYSFQFLTPLLDGFDVIPVELPGRGRRIKEALLNDFDQAAIDIYGQINARLNDAGFMLYGHSMGAYLGLRVANLLENAGRAPDHLIVSGNAGPGLKKRKYIYSCEKEELIDELENLGGVPAEVLDNEELFGFFEPILRADFEIAERNDLALEPPVQAPIFAMMGSEEDNVGRISNWGRFTRAEFDHKILQGGHFFIQQHPREVADVIRNCYLRTMLQARR